MAERIIPIVIEGKETVKSPNKVKTSLDSDNEQSKLSKSLEELSVTCSTTTAAAQTSGTRSTKPVEKQASPTPQSPSVVRSPKVKVKPAPVASKKEQEYLKGYDVLEKREGNPLLTDYTLPNCNVIERIVLVIDRAQDENYTPFIIGSQKYTPLSVLKRAISIFIKLKLGINPYHEFAIIVMNENNATLLMEFTSESKKLQDCLNRISECQAEDIFNLNTVFDIIGEVSLPEPHAPGLPPPFILRTIIFYGRSYTVPQITMTDKLQALFDHAFSICDVLVTHEPVEAANHCQKIFNVLQNLDQKGIAYFFPVCRDLRRMNKSTGKLLAHPLQRPIQIRMKN